MDVFLILLIKLLPLYIIIGLGYLAGRFLKVQKESLAPILIYILSPIIVFHGVVTTKLTPGILTIPLMVLLVVCTICILVYRLTGNLWKDTTRNILAFTAGTGNTGYFGLPVTVAIFGDKAIGIVALFVLGTVLYQNSLGFFITARGTHTVRESFIKILCLPAIYAFFLGIAINLNGFIPNQIYTDAMSYFRGAYTFLGMMIIGVGLSGITRMAFDRLFLVVSFSVKFLIWPLCFGIVILLDSVLFHLYTPDIYRIILLLSLVPLAADTVSFATLLKAQPEKAAFAVLISTLIALVLIPAVAPLISSLV